MKTLRLFKIKIPNGYLPLPFWINEPSQKDKPVANLAEKCITMQKAY